MNVQEIPGIQAPCTRRHGIIFIVGLIQKTPHDIGARRGRTVLAFRT
jgi:hypothetical protein